MKASVLTPFRSRNGKIFQAGDVIDAEPEKVEILVRDGLVAPISDDHSFPTHCAGCGHFIPDPVNPLAGYGECGQTGKGIFPSQGAGCPHSSPGEPISRVEAKGGTEILQLLEENPQGLPIDLLVERLPFPRREIGRTLSILRGRGQVVARVVGYRTLFTVEKRAECPLLGAEDAQLTPSPMEGK